MKTRNKILLLLLLICLSVFGYIWYKKPSTVELYTTDVMLLNSVIMQLQSNDYEEKKIKKLINHMNWKNNLETKEGVTTLIAAIMTGQRKGLEFLLENGENINFQNEKGETVLMYASTISIEDTIFLLQQKDINLDLVDNEGNNFIHYLTMNENDILFEKLKEKKKYRYLYKKKNNNGMTPEDLMINQLKKQLMGDK